MTHTMECPVGGELEEGGAGAAEEGETPARIGDYHVIGVLGEGALGVAYRCTPTAEEAEDLGDVCVTRIHDHLASDEAYRARFEEAAEQGLLLDHPNIARGHEALADEDHLALVTEVVGGMSLSRLLGQQAGPMAWDDAWPLLRKLLDAVDYAHGQDTLHGDLSPRNVMVQGGRLKVLGFGIPRDREGGPYAAPDEGDVEARSDVYTLGVITYRMLAGDLPWEDEDPESVEQRKRFGDLMPLRERCPEVKDELAAAVMSALRADPDDRPAGVKELREALEQGARTAGPKRPTVLGKVAVKRKRIRLSEASTRELEAIGIKKTRPAGTPPTRSRRPEKQQVPAQRDATPEQAAEQARQPPEAPARQATPATQTPQPAPRAVPVPPPRPGIGSPRNLAIGGAVVVLLGLALVMGMRGKKASTAPKVDPGQARAKAEAEARATITWAPLVGGSFQMGSAEGGDDEKPVHQVKVAPFAMTTSEVTVAQYRACVTFGDCTNPDTGEECNWGVKGRETHPVNCVDWDQARTFCRWARGRLPSEAQWEYAARGGGKAQKHAWGDEAPSCQRAVMSGEGPGCGEGGTMATCSKPTGKTAQGICDLAGNVAEWVEDCAHGDYEGAPADDNAWTAGCSSTFRGQRGGGWDASADSLRATYRYGGSPDNRGGRLGVRCVR